jgi:cytochrome c556
MRGLGIRGSSLALAAAVAFAGVIFAAGQSVPGEAPATSPAEIVKARQQGLKALGAAFKVIRDELRGDSPDAAKIRTASADITRAANAIDSWFPVGTGPQAGLKTDTRAEAWSDAAGFVAARDSFVREASRWAQLVNSTDVASWKDASEALGRSCKGCHDKYRLKRD